MRDIEEDILCTLREGKGDEELIAEQTLIEKLEESSSLSKSIASVLYEI
jgi:dynein heavy chain